MWETEIFDGGVDGVATAEKETDQPGTDVAAAAGDAHHFTPSHTSTLTRHAFSLLFSQLSGLYGGSGYIEPRGEFPKLRLLPLPSIKFFLRGIVLSGHLAW